MTKSFTREAHYTDFVTHQLPTFWAQRQEGHFIGQGGLALYWMRLRQPNPKGAVVVINGRVESSWKYQEIYYDLYQQGYDIYSYDHRGQGLSPRLNDSNIGHLDHFHYFVDDAHTFINHHLMGQGYRHIHLLAHSMGATIATLLLQRITLSSAVLCAPMYGLPLPAWLKPIVRPLMLTLDWVKRKTDYAPRQCPYYAKPFESNLLTHSEPRYQWFRQLYEDHPELQLGGVSRRWVAESQRAIQRCQALTPTPTPTLILQASEDGIVDNADQPGVSQRINAPMMTIANAKHEILFESDPARSSALAHICHFFEKAEQS